MCFNLETLGSYSTMNHQDSFFKLKKSWQIDHDDYVFFKENLLFMNVTSSHSMRINICSETCHNLQLRDVSQLNHWSYD